MCRINLWTYYVCVSSQRHLLYIYTTVLKTKLRHLTTSPCQIQITITRQYSNPHMTQRKSDISNTSYCWKKDVFYSSHCSYPYLIDYQYLIEILCLYIAEFFDIIFMHFGNIIQILETIHLLMKRQIRPQCLMKTFFLLFLSQIPHLITE